MNRFKKAVRNLTTEEKSEGGIWLPGGKQVLGSVAEVVAVCDPYETDFGLQGPVHSVGDIVVIGKYTGVDVEIGRDKLIVTQETDILGKLIEAKEEETTDAHS